MHSRLPPAVELLVPLVVLILHQVLGLEPLLRILPFHVDLLQSLRRRLRLVCDVRLTLDVGRRKPFIVILRVLLLPDPELLLVLLLPGGVVELTKNVIILMGLPILIDYPLVPLLDI